MEKRKNKDSHSNSSDSFVNFIESEDDENSNKN